MKRSLSPVFSALSFTAPFVATAAHAEQFVVAEAAYTHSAQTTKDSHYRVEPGPETPPDWQSPLDYTGGSVHVRLEVKTKPTDTPTRYQICFEMKQNYCCTDQAPIYTQPGVYEWDTLVSKLWRPGPVDFTQGILQSALILKDKNNVKPAPENVGQATSDLYMPTDLHVTVTVVSTGATYRDPNAASGGSGGGAAAAGSAESGGASPGGGAGSGGAAGVATLSGSAGTDGNDGGSSGAGGAAALGGGSAATPANLTGGGGGAGAPIGFEPRTEADAGDCSIGKSRSNGAAVFALAAPLAGLWQAARHCQPW
ncbi:MAG TPA: hypothetical protein VHB79_19365 [Polyangiaceae bacterium]|nr:hypothetical protein [Polyangiaceae bacterium]